DMLLDEGRGVAAIALEGEFHVLGGHRLAIVELGAGAQHEAVAEPVRGGGVGFRQTWLGALSPARVSRPGLAGLEPQERGGNDPRFRRVEPGRRQRDVGAIDKLVVTGPRGPGAGGQDAERGKTQQVASRRGRRGTPGDGIVMVASRRAHEVTPWCGNLACQLFLIVTSSYGAE